jgi:demethylmenaquinone methyltransferase/2-methoxy-6-polyprenyl-1,4-benzoquinol methylase
MAPDRVSFGFREVSPEEKRKLVRAQFDPIAATYDLADAVLSAGQDTRWRKKGIGLLGLQAGESVLDLCGGTGDFALLAAERTGDRGRAIIYDFNPRMMEAGRRKIRRSPYGRIIRCIQGDAESISFSDESFDAVTLGFGLRNFVHTELGLKEIHRVLKPAGRLVILEFSLPSQRFLRALYHFYSFRVMPFAARVICGTDGPFRYLAESIRVFPPPEKVAEFIREAGFLDIRFRRLSLGLATLYAARKNGVWKKEIKNG